MKKFFKSTTILLIIIVIALLAACEPKSFEENIEFIELPKTFDRLEEALVNMDEEGTLELEYTNEWGMFITKIAGKSIALVNDNAANTYISIYINSNDIELIDPTVTPLTAAGKTFYAAGAGVSELPISEGVKFLFCTVTFGMTTTINEGFIILE